MRQVTHLAGWNLAAVTTDTAVFLMAGDEYDESVPPAGRCLLSRWADVRRDCDEEHGAAHDAGDAGAP